MKKFLDKLKNKLSLMKKSKSSEYSELEDQFVDNPDQDNLEDEFFDEDSPTDPSLSLNINHQKEKADLTQELIIKSTDPGLSLDFPPPIEEEEEEDAALPLAVDDVPNHVAEVQTPSIPGLSSISLDNLKSNVESENVENQSVEEKEYLDEELDITDPNFVQMPQPTLLSKVKSFVEKTKTSLLRRPHIESLDDTDELSDSQNSHVGIDDTGNSNLDDFNLDEQPKTSIKDKAAKLLNFAFLKKLFKKKEQKESQSDIPGDEVSSFKKSSSNTSLSLSQFAGLGFFHWLFNVKTRPTLHRSFLILFWIFIFFNIGKFSALIFNGTKVKKVTSRSVGAPIEINNLSRSIFNKLASQDIFQASMKKEVVKEVKVEVADQEELCLRSDTQSKLKSFYYLFNTIVLKNSKKSLASFQVRSDPELLEIREGENIDNRFRIDRIGRLRVIGKNLNSNKCEYFENEKVDNASQKINTLSKSEAKAAKTKLKAIQGIQNDGNKVKIKRTFLNEQLSNISGLLKQALAIPINNPDGSVAFRITDIEPGSIYSYLNIQNGDTITEINGNKIATQNEVLSLFSKLKTVKKLQLTVKRGGAPQQLDYTFE